MYFVTGITGHVGGATAKHLTNDGHKVRALVRDPAKAAHWSNRGVEILQGDLNDAEKVEAALRGVEGAFLMLPPNLAPEPGFPEAKGIIAAYLKALEQTPAPKLVVLSSIGSERSSGLGMITRTHLLEQALNKFSQPTAFVRAGSFLENFAMNFQPAVSSGWFDTFYSPTDRTVPMIATEDIGKQIAHLLTSKWTGKRIVELGSRVSPDEVAHAMGEAVGREVKARAIPRDKWAFVLESFGIPHGRTGAFEEMADGVNEGRIDFGLPGAEQVPATVTPTEFFAEMSNYS